MKIYEAAVAVLREAGHPMQAKDIYNEIAKRKLFQFGAKNPTAILAQTLRKKSDAPLNKGEIIFVKKSDNTYALAEWSKK